MRLTVLIAAATLAVAPVTAPVAAQDSADPAPAATAPVFTAADAAVFAEAWIGRWTGTGRELDPEDGVTYRDRTVALNVFEPPVGGVRFVVGDGEEIFDAAFVDGVIEYAGRGRGGVAQTVTARIESFEIDPAGDAWAFVAAVELPGPDGTTIAAEELQAGFGDVITRRIVRHAPDGDGPPQVLMDMRFTRTSGSR